MSWSIAVCNYNLAMPLQEPIRYNGQKKRLKRLGPALRRLQAQEGQIDVFCFQEVIPPEYRRRLTDVMKDLGFPHQTKPLNTTFMSGKLKLVSGGVLVFSRHPILATFNCVFDTDCQEADCTACKGVVYARILLPDENVVNVLSTHFQAWDTPRARDIRKQQAQQLADFLSSLSIKADEPVLLAGDINLDLYACSTEVKALMKRMGFALLQPDKSGSRFTSDPDTNAIVGNDVEDMYATELYPKGCYDVFLKTGSCPCCPREWLDYVTYSTKHLPPVRSSVKAAVLKVDPFEMNLNITTTRTVQDLSDHYPVIGRFSFDRLARYRQREIETDDKAFSDSNVWLVVCFFVVLACASAMIVTYFCLKRT